MKIRIKKEGPHIKTRIITALVALPLLILLILFAPQNLFNLFVTVVAGLGLFEFFAMTLPGERRMERGLAALVGALFAAFLCWEKSEYALLVLTGSFLLFAIIYLFRYRDLSTVIVQLGLTLMGFFYLPLLLSFFSKLRMLDSGVEWVFLILALVMVGDSAALFVGSAIGKTKLYPAISPNKTVEGALGGLAGSLVAVLLYSNLFLPSLSLVFAVVFALIVGVVSQVGDLFESMLKRSCGVKDSGRMIPGHGGLLDRLDSLLFAFPTAYCLVLFLGA